MEHFAKGDAHCAAQAESLRYNFLDGFATHRACHGVVGFIMNNGTKDCEVLTSGKWPQRAEAMKSEDGSLTSSGKSRCCTSHSTQLKARIEEALSKNVTFYSPTEERVLPAASTNEPEEREFVVDSGAFLHMVSERHSDAAELETMGTSRSPTTVIMANGEVQTREEATETSKNWTYS